jgi:hypothetical protein
LSANGAELHKPILADFVAAPATFALQREASQCAWRKGRRAWKQWDEAANTWAERQEAQAERIKY